MKFAMERGMIVVGLLLAGCQESRFISCMPRTPFVEARSYDLHDPFPDESIGPKTFSRPRTFADPRSDTRKSFDLRNLQASRNLSPGTSVISSRTPPNTTAPVAAADDLAPRYNVVPQRTPDRLAAVCLVAIIIVALPCTGRAQSPARNLESTAGDMILPETQKAIDKGLLYLANRQHPDGSFGSGTTYRRNVAVTSLAGMAFLSAGSTPGRGTYGKHVDKTIEFILASAKPNGFIVHEASSGHGPMYGHGFATLFLAEVYGMSPRDKVRDALKSAVQLIVNSQNREGGWRYEPDGKDADISVTVCQMMALRAARNCGLSVPKTTVDQCVEYVKACQNADGGFRYQRLMRPQSEFPRSAAGVVTLYNAGLTEGREIERGLGYLLRFQPRGDLLRYDAHYFYGQYYAVQAMWHAGDDRWKQWYPAIRDELTIRQLPDGSWNDSLINNEYATAMACLVLQMPNNYLPIFQR